MDGFRLNCKRQAVFHDISVPLYALPEVGQLLHIGLRYGY